MYYVLYSSRHNIAATSERQGMTRHSRVLIWIWIRSAPCLLRTECLCPRARRVLDDI